VRLRRKNKIRTKTEYGIWNILYVIFYILNAPASAVPFSSWIDVKAECGAVGDGKADDTAAIQKGLDLIRPERTGSQEPSRPSVKNTASAREWGYRGKDQIKA
jgi:hypothetical protein